MMMSHTKPEMQALAGLRTAWLVSADCAIVQLDSQAHMIGNTCPRANGGSGSPLGRLPAVSATQSHP
jgi:hypothetical protein